MAVSVRKQEDTQASPWEAAAVAPPRANVSGGKELTSLGGGAKHSTLAVMLRVWRIDLEATLTEI